MDLNQFIIDNVYLEKVHTNNVYNKTIINYFDLLFKEMSADNWNSLLVYITTGRMSLHQNLLDSKVRIERCNKYWLLDVYDHSQIKDFVSTNLCKNKFCNNCKKVKQASRMSKYIPFLEDYKDNLYHMTLTLPNVSGLELHDTIVKMTKSFKSLIRYLDGNKKLGFLNLANYGYIGCVRSLEITFNQDNYHPHFHCAFAFDNLNLDKKNFNTYSYDYKKGRGSRAFSDFEIIIQKIWYLLLNDFVVNSQNFNNLDLGYSCNCDKFSSNDYAELFKYMTKETDEKDNILSYENFKCLYFSTYRLKQIQGYGCFYRITDDDLDDEIDLIYKDIKNFLSSSDEIPGQKLQTVKELLLDDKYTLISRKKIYQYLREIEKNTEKNDI